jgi:hypothetical protein
MQKPSRDRPWAITYNVGIKRLIMGRYTSRADAEMSIATLRRIVTYDMQIIWDGTVQDLEKLATGGR